MTERIRGSDQVRAYYDAYVPQLNQPYVRHRWQASPIRREHFRQTRDRIVSELRGRRFERAVEVGCGPLVWTPMIVAHARGMIAIDLSLAMLKDAEPREVGNVARCCGDAAMLPLGAGTVDALCSIRAFEYFPDKHSAVAEFARVLADGGYLMIVTKNRLYKGYEARGRAGRVDEANDALHSGSVTAQELVALLRAEGFQSIVVRPVIAGRTNHPVVWKAARWIFRMLKPRWSQGLPAAISGAVESFMITGVRPRRILNPSV